MRKLLIAALALGAVPASARVMTAVPRIAGPAAVPFGALARPTLGAPALSPTASLLSAPSLAPTLSLAPAPSPLLQSALPAPSAAALPAAAEAPNAKATLENAGAALAAPNADQAAVSRRTFDAALAAPSDAPSFLPPGGAPNFRAPDHYENGRIGNAVGLLSQARTPIGADLYAKAYADYGASLQVLVDDDRHASYDARLHWQNGRPVLSLTQDLLRRGSDAVLASFLVRELSHLYYRDFPDSAERSWMAHSAMVRTFAEITGSSRGWWDYHSDLNRDGREVMRSFYDSWTDALSRGNDPRNGTYFQWLKSGSDSKSGPNASLSLREQYDRGLIGWGAYRQMDQYFGSLVDSERRWLRARP